MTRPKLSVRGVSRSFGATRALDRVDLDLGAGEVHALVGENGAGKSTLVNILAGVLSPDHGTISVDGAATRFRDRQESIRAGVGVVFQHFSLVDRLTVAENFELGRPDAGRWVRPGEARRAIGAWTTRAGVEVDSDVRVGDLSVAEKQRVEFVLALARGARVLLLDEPTAVLSPEEAASLLDLVRGIADEGVAVLMVTHKFPEVEAVADRVTVLRAGVVTGRHSRDAGFSREHLVDEMMGAERLSRAAVRPPGERIRLEVDGLTVGRLRDLVLGVAAGEIVGVAGVVGSGQGDLLRAVAGVTTPVSGRVRVDGTDVTGDPGAARRAGVGYLPEDRAREGLALDLPLWVNATAKELPNLGMWRGLDREAVAASTERVVRYLDVTPSHHQSPAGELSGGNQQRLVAGRELSGSPAVVAAAEPTRGLDPVARVEVGNAIKEVAAAGAAVVVTSVDLDELIELAGRIVVVAGGVATLDVPVQEASRARIGAAMAASA